MSAYPSLIKFKLIHGKKIIINYNQIFKNISILGQGGNGIVIKVMDIISGKYYALKTINKYDDDTIREIEILRQFSNEFGSSVVKYYNYFFYQNVLCILMEYIHGVTVDEYFNNNFSLLDFINFAVWLTSIISLLHKKNYVHRDIKPSNIMVVNGKYKLIDFGYSCRVGKINVKDNLSCTVSTPGTPYYAAPEIYNGTFKKNINKYYKTIDVYACGVTLYNILTGKFPYKLYNHSIIMSNYIHININQIPRILNNYINNLIHQMVLINPDNRITIENAKNKFILLQQNINNIKY